jgi:hypothetical protein
MWEPLLEKWSFELELDFGATNKYKKRIDLLADQKSLNLDISDEMVIYP